MVKGQKTGGRTKGAVNKTPATARILSCGSLALNSKHSKNYPHYPVLLTPNNLFFTFYIKFRLTNYVPHERIRAVAGGNFKFEILRPIKKRNIVLVS